DAQGAEAWAALPQSKPDYVTMIVQKVAPDPTQESKQQNKENPLPEKSKIARKVNKTKQSFTNEDENLKIVQQDKSIRITNKSNLTMTIKRVSGHYNGRGVENMLSTPVVILPKSISAELNRNNSIVEEFDDFESFGIAATYQIRSADRDKSLSRVNLYAEDGVAEDLAEGSRLGLTGDVKVAKSTTVNEPLIATDAEETSDNTATSEWKIVLNIKFDTNKTVIKRGYYPRMKEIAETLKENPGMIGVIEGHTD